MAVSTKERFNKVVIGNILFCNDTLSPKKRLLEPPCLLRITLYITNNAG